MPGDIDFVEAAEQALYIAGSSLFLYAGFSFSMYISNYLTYTKLKEAPTLPISGLRSLLSSPSEGKENLMVIRGFVHPARQGPGQEYVVLRENHGYITAHTEQELMEPYSITRIPQSPKLPFILTEGVRGSHSVSLSLDPPTTFHHIQPALHTDLPIPYLDDSFRPIGLVNQKMLAIGKEITAVGFCTSQDGNPQIFPCKNFPYFLSEMTPDEMLSQLDHTCRTWYSCTIVLGSLAFGVFGYLVIRSFILRKRKRLLRRKYEVAVVDAADFGKSEACCALKGSHSLNRWDELEKAFDYEAEFTNSLNGLDEIEEVEAETSSTSTTKPSSEKHRRKT